MEAPRSSGEFGRPQRLRWDHDQHDGGHDHHDGGFAPSNSPPSRRRPAGGALRHSTPHNEEDLALSMFADQTGGMGGSGSAPTSPVAAGVAMWGSRTPLSRRGEVQHSTRSSAEARGMWVCAVCYYTENKAATSKCFICGARNPALSSSMVVHECPRCGRDDVSHNDWAS